MKTNTGWLITWWIAACLLAFNGVAAFKEKKDVWTIQKEMQKQVAAVIHTPEGLRLIGDMRDCYAQLALVKKHSNAKMIIMDAPPTEVKCWSARVITWRGVEDSLRGFINEDELAFSDLVDDWDATIEYSIKFPNDHTVEATKVMENTFGKPTTVSTCLTLSFQDTTTTNHTSK